MLEKDYRDIHTYVSCLKSNEEMGADNPAWEHLVSDWSGTSKGSLLKNIY